MIPSSRILVLFMLRSPT